MHGDLDRLIEFIAEHFAFTEEKYPALKEATDRERFLFATNHSILHLSKITGKIASVGEAVDHGKELDMDELKEQTAKALATVLRLAELAGMDEAELVRRIEEKYKAKVSG